MTDVYILMSTDKVTSLQRKGENKSILDNMPVADGTDVAGETIFDDSWNF